MKVILNSTQFRFNLKQVLSLEKITAEIVATAALPVGHLIATDCNAAACAYFLTIGMTYHENCITLSLHFPTMPVTYQTNQLCKFSNNLCDISGQLYHCIIPFSDNVRDTSSQLPCQILLPAMPHGLSNQEWLPGDPKGPRLLGSLSIK